MEINSNRTVLIVDDEEYSRLYLATMLNELYPGIVIKAASTAREAEQLIYSQDYDTLFLDVEMPGKSGITILNELREKGKAYPVIYVSAYERFDFARRAIQLNATDYLVKPVSGFDLKLATDKAFAEWDNREKPVFATAPEESEDRSRFCLITAKGHRYFLPHEVVYFSTTGRYASVFYVDGSMDALNRSLTALNESLPKPEFQQVSRQYVVNMSFVRYFSKKNKTITVMCGNDFVELDRIFPKVFEELLPNKEE